MSSFSCLKEYFNCELSSFGRLTGQTDMIGRAESLAHAVDSYTGSLTFVFGPDLILFWAVSEYNYV